MPMHPTAVLQPGAELGRDVEIGAYSILGPQVRLRDGVCVSSHVVIEGRTTIGEASEIFPFAVIGGRPGHLKDAGAGTELVIGARASLREHVTIHRGTKLGRGKTVVGDDCTFLAGSHAGHDCIVGNGVLMVNGAVLGGHVEVGDYATIGGLAAVHQHARIGTMAMIGGNSGVVSDIPPYCMAQGDRARLIGLNEIGLERRGLSAEVIGALRKAYRIVFRSGELRKAALDRVRAEFPPIREIQTFVDFIGGTKRGVARHGRGGAS